MSYKFTDVSEAAEVPNILNELGQSLMSNAGDSVHASDCGLDSRCGYIYLLEDGILVDSENARKSIEYYAGFEYINDDHRTTFGDYTLYSSEHSRVQDVIDWYNEKMCTS